jgi:hypothetical protein
MFNDEAHPSQGEEEKFGVHEACINKEAFFSRTIKTSLLRLCSLLDTINKLII